MIFWSGSPHKGPMGPRKASWCGIILPTAQAEPPVKTFAVYRKPWDPYQFCQCVGLHVKYI